MFKLIKKLLKDERKAAAIKFVLIASLITLAIIIIMDAFGTSLKNLF